MSKSCLHGQAGGPPVVGLYRGHGMTGGLRANRRGALWMLVAGLMFTLHGYLRQTRCALFFPGRTGVYRSFVGLLVIWIIVRCAAIRLATPYWRQHLNRSLSGFGALSMFFYDCCIAVGNRSHAQLHLIIVHCCLISTLMLRERPPWQLIFAVMLALSAWWRC